MQEPRIRLLLAALMPWQPKRVYIFGSWARGEVDELSDLDVVVIQETPLPFLDRLQLVGQTLPDDLGALDLLVYTFDECAAMLQRGNASAELIDSEGCLIYGAQD